MMNFMQELSSLWTIAIRERDEASERLQNSLAQLSKLETIFNTIMSSEQVKEQASRLQNCNYNHFSNDSPSQFSFASPAISDYDSCSSSTNQMGFVVQNKRDYETVVFEAIGGVLPENGKFLQTVVEAGPLLESLHMIGPVPKLRNPPDQRPVPSNNIGGKWNYLLS